MLTCGVLTLHGNQNYGNRLQAYAMLKTLRQVGLSATQLEMDVPTYVPSVLASGYFLAKAFRVIYQRLRGSRQMDGASAKESILSAFTTTFIPTRHISIMERKQFAKQYDIFIVGSDQVWNLSSPAGNMLRLTHKSDQFLSFASPIQRIAYAASFGVSTIDTKLGKYYCNLLNEMDSISVRERAGADLILELTGRRVPVVLDPVMLLDRAEWFDLPLPKHSQIPSKPFIFSYVLRGWNAKARAQIETYATRHGLQILDVMGDFYDSTHTVLTPAEFVQAIDRAQLVVTDSFHGSAFSILMNTPVLTIARVTGEDMGSRLDSLFEMFGFEDYRLIPGMDIDGFMRRSSFSHANEVLRKKRVESLNYLHSAIDRASIDLRDG